MFDSYPSKYLKEGEELKALFRRHPLTLVRPLALPVVFLLADFFFLSWLLAQRSWGLALFTVIAVATAVLIARALVLWTLDLFLVTDVRVIDVDRRGFFHTTVSETTYDKIQDISFSVRGVWQTLLHYGSVTIQTAGTQGNLEIGNVARPQEVQELLVAIQKQAAQRAVGADEPPAFNTDAAPPKPSLELQRLLTTLREIRDEMGAEAFAALLEREFFGEHRPSKRRR